MASENLTLYDNETETVNTAIRFIFSIFTALKPLRRLGHIVAPVCTLCEALVGFASGGSQLYYTARYAKANHIRKGTLASTNILTSALLIAATASSASIGGPFAFAGVMWYVTMRSAEATYRAKQKMDLRYLFDNRLEKLRFVHGKLAKNDIDDTERQRLESVKKRLEVQLLAIAVETFHVHKDLEKALTSDILDNNKKQQYTQEKEKFEFYHQYFNDIIDGLVPSLQTVTVDVDDTDIDAANNKGLELPVTQADNPYIQFHHAYNYAIGASSSSQPRADEDEDYEPQSPNQADIPKYLHMPRDKARVITRYLYDKQREKYIAKTRKTLIWGVSAIGITLIAACVVCPHAAAILAPLGLSFCLAAAALKVYDLFRDLSNYRARYRLEKHVLLQTQQGQEQAESVTPPVDTTSPTGAELIRPSPLPVDSNLINAVIEESSSSSSAESVHQSTDKPVGSQSEEAPTDEHSHNSPSAVLTDNLSEIDDSLEQSSPYSHLPEPPSSSASLSTSASHSADAADESLTLPVVDSSATELTPAYVPAPSLSARLCSFFNGIPLPDDFENKVRQQTIAICKEHKLINPDLDETALGDKDFKHLKTLAGRFLAR